MEVLGGFAAQSLQRLLRVRPLQHQPAPVQVSAVAQGREGFLQKRKKKELKEEIRAGWQEGRQRRPSLCPGVERPPENIVLGVLCSDGAGSISIRGSDSVIYLPCTCSRANSHHRCCRLEPSTGWDHPELGMPQPLELWVSTGWHLATPWHPALCWNTGKHSSAGTEKFLSALGATWKAAFLLPTIW